MACLGGTNLLVAMRIVKPGGRSGLPRECLDRGKGESTVVAVYKLESTAQTALLSVEIRAPCECYIPSSFY